MSWRAKPLIYMLAGLLLVGGLMAGSWWVWQHRSELMQQAVSTLLARWKDKLDTRDLRVEPDGTVNAQSLRYHDEKVSITVTGLQAKLALDWSFAQKMRATAVSVTSIQIDLLQPPSKAAWPALTAPVDFTLESLSVGRLLVRRDGKALLDLHTIRGALAYQNKVYQTTQLSAGISQCGASCSAQFSGNLLSAPPFQTRGDLVFTYPLLDHPLVLKGKVSGSLFDLKIDGSAPDSGQYRGLLASHHTTISLLEPKDPWLSIAYKIPGLTQSSLRVLGVNVPLAKLDLSAEGRLDFGAEVRGPIALQNKTLLSLSEGGLPFTRSAAELVLGANGLRLQDWNIDQHRQGSLSLAYQSLALELAMPVSNLNPVTWVKRADSLPDQWNGKLRVNIASLKTPSGKQQFSFEGESVSARKLLGSHLLELAGQWTQQDWTLDTIRLRSLGGETVVKEVSGSAKPTAAALQFQGLDLARVPSSWWALASKQAPEPWLSYLPADVTAALRVLDGKININGSLDNASIDKIELQSSSRQGAGVDVVATRTARRWDLAGSISTPGKQLKFEGQQQDQANAVASFSLLADRWKTADLDIAGWDLRVKLREENNAITARIESNAKTAASGSTALTMPRFALTAVSNSAGPGAWSGLLESGGAQLAIANRRPLELQLLAPSRYTWKDNALSVDAVQLTTSVGGLELQGLKVSRSGAQVNLSSSLLDSDRIGQYVGLPESFRAATKGARLAGKTELALVFDSSGSINAAASRAKGRLQLADADKGRSVVAVGENAFGLSAFSVEFSVADSRLRLQAALGSSRNGEFNATASLPLDLSGSAPALSRELPLEADANGTVDAALLGPLVDKEVRLAGALAMTLKVRGSLANPQTTGTLQGNSLALTHPPSNLALRDGVLRASIDTKRLTIEQWSMFQPGTPGQRGEISVSGAYTWGGTSEDKLLVTTKRFVLPIAPDQRVVVSGQGSLLLKPSAVMLEANLRADQARLILRRDQTTELGSDVRIIGRQQGAGSAAVPAPRGGRDLQFTSVIALDLGPDFRFSGEGIKGRLEGKVNLSASGADSLRSIGSVAIVEGSYARFGQSLTIERGFVRFAGPIDNPSLDIEAKRPNLPVDVSVLVAGTAQAPRVRLQSATAMSEAEKLSWLALGAPLGDSLGAEQSGTLASALAALLADASGAESNLTQALGLAQLGVAKNDKGTNVVSVGKRLGDRLLITYEQGLRGVWNILRVQLQLTKQLELRVQAGTESSVDLLWVIPLQQ